MVKKETSLPDLLHVDIEKDFEPDHRVSPPGQIDPQRAPTVPLTPKEILAMTEEGLLRLGTLDEQLRFAKTLIDQKMVSSSFETPQQVVVGIQYARAMGFEPVVGLRMMYVVNGRPSLWGDGPLSLCATEIDSIEEFFIDENCAKICVDNKNVRSQIFGAVTRIKRTGDPVMQEDWFTLDDLKRAGIDKSKFGKKDVWAKFERNMLRYKARSMVLKTKFADKIAGAPIAEHDFHYSPDSPEVQVMRNAVADELNARFLRPGKGTVSVVEAEKNPEPQAAQASSS